MSAAGSDHGAVDSSASSARSTAGSISARRQQRSVSRLEGRAKLTEVKEAAAELATDEGAAATPASCWRDAARGHLSPTMRQLSSFDDPVLDVARFGNELGPNSICGSGLWEVRVWP